MADVRAMNECCELADERSASSGDVGSIHYCKTEKRWVLRPGKPDEEGEE